MDKIEARNSMVDSIIRRERLTVMASAADQIILTADNYEDFDNHLDPKQLRAGFVQDNWFKGSFRQFEIYRQKYLFQTVKQHRDKAFSKYRINLAWLDPKPEIIQFIAWKWVSSALATAIWAAVLIYLSCCTSISSDLGLSAGSLDSAAVLMSTITVISLCLFFYSNESKLVFNSYLSNVPLIEIDINKPDKASFDAFVHDIRGGIYAGWQNKDIQQMLVGEMRELRRLRDARVLSEATYLRARTDIFNHREYQIKSVQIEEALDKGEN